MKRFMILITVIAAAYLSVPGAAVAQGENDTLWTKMIDGITEVKFSPDGKNIAFSRQNGEIYIVNSVNGDSIYKFDPLNGYIFDYSPDGQFIISCGKGVDNKDSEKVRLWNLGTKTLLRYLIDTISSEKYGVKVAQSVVYSPNGKYIAVGYLTGSNIPPDSWVVVWETEKFKPVTYNYYPKAFLTKIRFTPDGKKLAISLRGKSEGYVLFIDGNTWDSGPSMIHPDMVEDFTFTSDGSKLITGCDDNSIRIWNTETRELEKEIKEEGDIRALGISKDDKYLFYQWMGGLNGGLLKKDINSEKVLYNYNINIFPISKTTMTSIDISPNDQSFIAGSSLGICLYKSDLLSSINETEQLIETIYPNPTNGMIKINFFNPKYQFLRIELQNISGALIDTIFCGNLEQGEQSINYNGNDIFAGNYIITISAKGFSKSFKFIKEK